MSDWAAETVFYRMAVGVLAFVALLILVRMRHRSPERAIGLLPPLVVSTIR